MGTEAVALLDGKGGEGENPSLVFSYSRIDIRDAMFSHGGATMFARYCFLRRRANQRGRLARWGGIRGGVGPFRASIR